MNEYKPTRRSDEKRHKKPEDSSSQCTVRPLFDRLIEGIKNDTSKIEAPHSLSSSVVCYTDNRTGRKASMRSARYFAITQLLPGLIKKFIGVSNDLPIISEKERSSDAEADFLASNRRCELFNNTFDPSTLSGFIQSVLGEVAVMIEDAFEACDVLNFSTIAHSLRVGPGSSSDVQTGTGTFWKLMQSRITFSSVLVYQVYRACTHVSPLTHVAETTRRALYGRHDFFNSCAQYLSVHKTRAKNRGICKQPSGNMVLQLATHNSISSVLLRWFDCNLEDQQVKNRMLAKLGSYQKFHMEKRTWEFCTLDLTEASNFPAIIVRFLFPLTFVRWLALIRSAYITVGGNTYEKHMLSTMGNGFTFSLMTLLLSAIVKVLYSFADLPEYDTFSHHNEFGAAGDRIKTWAVYGDDIIVDARVYKPLIQVLSALGFIVNTDKSYSAGPFRESCGGDYYDGYDVRPVFVKDLDTQADIFSLLNRLNNWSVFHSVPLPTALGILRSALGEDQNRFVPNWEGVDAGIHAPYSMYKRPSLNQIPFPLRKEIDPYFETNGVKSPSIFYKRYMPIAQKDILYKETRKTVQWTCSESGRTFSYEATLDQYHLYTNIFGVLVCTLEGSVLNGQCGVRQNGDPTYRDEWALAPQWGDPSLVRGSSFTRTSTHSSISVYKFWEELTRRNYVVPPKRLSLVKSTPTCSSLTFAKLTSLNMSDISFSIDYTLRHFNISQRALSAVGWHWDI